MHVPLLVMAPDPLLVRAPASSFLPTKAHAPSRIDACVTHPIMSKKLFDPPELDEDA